MEEKKGIELINISEFGTYTWKDCVDALVKKNNEIIKRLNDIKEQNVTREKS